MRVTLIADYIVVEEERRTISRWLSPLDFKAMQSDYLQKRAEGSGQWLLESPQFRHWRDGRSETLWCPGRREFMLVTSGFGMRAHCL
jgi:hypothetical protein